jgi:hypothetical protein
MKKNKSIIVLLMLIVFISLCSSFATPISIGNFANNTDIYKENFSLYLNVSSFDDGGVCTLTKYTDGLTPTNLFTSDQIGINRMNDYVFFVNFDSLSSNTSICYQETSTVATSGCGGSSGDYSSNLKPAWIDGDWATGVAMTDATETMLGYINYTVPAFTNSALLQLRFGSQKDVSNLLTCGGVIGLATYTENITVYDDCLAQDVLQLQVEAEKSGGNYLYGYINCWDGNSWELLRNMLIDLKS